MAKPLVLHFAGPVSASAVDKRLRCDYPRAPVVACGNCHPKLRLAKLSAKHSSLADEVSAGRYTKQGSGACHTESKSADVDCKSPEVQLADNSIPTRIAIAMIQAYKDLVSPLLPSVCRFQPSCSTYSIEAFQQFGPSQGLTLMAWRILRCNPFRGGYQGQYDPPCWPPVGLEMWFKQ